MKINQEAQKRLVIFNKLSLSHTHTTLNRLDHQSLTPVHMLSFQRVVGFLLL